ncbi:ribosome biogenesis protein [Candidatus Woesearchaeota archaeon]|nr:ribosome biogenesis protein [Candidatus Woesearchaeota archaeon]
MQHILKCQKCNKYTLKKECCGEKTIETKPPKYSPEDKYAKYRREVKADDRKGKGLI